MIFRVRARFSPVLIPYFLIFDPGDFVMMRKLMLGVKQRAGTSLPVLITSLE